MKYDTIDIVPTPPPSPRQTEPNSILPPFSPGVLVGNWFEERRHFVCEPPQDQHYRSVYSSDFSRPRPTIERDPTEYLTRVESNRGLGHVTLFSHHGQKYDDNISTTYDLTLNHFPRCRSKPKHPHELLKNYGNITAYGLADYKKQVWDLDKRSTFYKTTEYRERYPAPREGDFEKVRVAIPKNLSSILGENNVKMKDVSLRGQPLGVVPEIVPQTVKNHCAHDYLMRDKLEHAPRCPKY